MRIETKRSLKGTAARCSGFLNWKLIALLIAVAMTPFFATAQLSGTGAISGTVTDTTGAVIPNAAITVTSVATGENTVRTSTGSGDYNVTPLTPGGYTVTVTASGFRTFVQQNVTVNALETVALNIRLAIGSAEQTITVSSAPPVLETTNATLGGVMDNQMYSSLPLLMGAGGNADQRRATDFAALMPGVQTNYIGSGNATDASGAVNGGNPAGGTSEIYIDGVNLPEADGIGDPRFTWTAFGMDAIDQFQVQTSGYSAQYAGQGVQNYSIRQGSNQWHGGVYEYIRNTVLDAWKFTSKVPTVTGIVPQGQTCAFGSPASSYCAPGGVKPAEIMNEVGAKFGGPIIHNKLFMFYNYGQYRNQNGPTIKLQTIPTLAMLGYGSNGSALGYADFTGYAAANPGYNIYDPGSQTPGCLGSAASPCTRAQFSNNGTLNQIPGSRISAAAQYINKYLLPYEATTLQNQYSNNIATGYVNGLANWYQGGRIDYDMNEKNQLSIIVAFGRQASTGPNSSGAANQLGPPFNTNQSYTPKTTVDIVKDTFTINPHMVNVVAVAFGRYKSLSVNPNDAPQYAASQTGLLGTPTGQASYFPLISFSNNTSCPPSSGGGVDNPCNEGGYDWNQKVNNTYSASDNFQWQFGKHELTFGGQVVEVQFNYIKNESFSSPLTYTFANTQTGGWSSGTSLNSTSGSSVASYMIGAVSSSSITVGVPGLGSRWLDPSFWVQDDYKVTPKLTLNLGLRWDIWPAVHEVHNLITWLNPTATNSVTGNLGTLSFAGGSSSDGYHTGMPIPSSTFYGNFAPRVGFAYALNDKTVIRSSYSLDFARGDWTSGSQSGSPSTTGLTPSASAAAGTVNQPSFYWDGTACSNGTADGVACGWTGSIAAPAPPAGGASLAEFGTSETTALTNSGAVSPNYWDPHYGSRTPEYINWTFGVERQLTPNMSISISYVGSEGHFLSTGSNKAIGSRNNELPESVRALAGYVVTGGVATPCTGFCSGDLLGLTAGSSATNPMSNIALATGLGFTPPNPYNAANATFYYKNTVASYFEPFPQYSGVSDTTGFMGNENWNALEISLRQRPSHGFNMMINYTYSKSIDDLGTFRVGDNDRLDRSLSAADLPQNLVGTVVYQLPVGRGHWMGDNMIYRSIMSDWTASGIFSYHSGFPIAVTGSGCGGSSILNQCMPSIIAGQAGRQNGAYGKNVTSAPGSPNYIGNVQYIDPGAFTVATAGTASNYGTSVNTTSTQATYVGDGPALYVPGNAPRVGALNIWGMGYYDADVAVKRTFPVYREWNLAFELDMTNVTNHTVWASPNAVVNGGSSFGTITALSSAYSPRDVQGALRINF
jgi:hypothetical protein